MSSAPVTSTYKFYGSYCVIQGSPTPRINTRTQFWGCENCKNIGFCSFFFLEMSNRFITYHKNIYIHLRRGLLPNMKKTLRNCMLKKRTTFCLTCLVLALCVLCNDFGEWIWAVATPHVPESDTDTKLILESPLVVCHSTYRSSLKHFEEFIQNAL